VDVKFSKRSASVGPDSPRSGFRRAIGTVLVCLVAIGFSGRLAASGQDDPGRPPGVPAAAGWAGFKNRLAGRGINPGLTYFGEAFTDVAGGLRRGSVYIGNLSLTLSLDMGKLAGWSGGTLFLYGMNLQDGDLEDYFGDIQGVSSIAAPGATRLYEAWIEQDLFDGRLSFLAGLYDLNSEFDTLEAASVFVNPSQGIDPTFAFSGLNGPSVFPYTTLGVRARIRTAGFYLQSVVLNGLAGNPDHPGGTQVVFRRENGALVTLEAGYHFPVTPGRHLKQPRRQRIRRYVQPAYAGKIALGLWGYTARFGPLLSRPQDPAKIRGDLGLYSLFSHTVWREDDNPGRNLMAFARVGLANPRLNRLGLFAGGGLVFTGLVPGRGLDIAGLAFATAFNGDDYMKKAALESSPVRRAEWNLELTYQAHVLSWLDLHPDIQYVIHPGMNPAVRNALGFDLRVEISL
jgi:porin